MLEGYINTTMAQELMRQKELNAVEEHQLYHWYWGANYSPSAEIQELRLQVARRLGL